MIAVVLGLPGSASTWVFNVSRKLIAAMPETAVSLYADRASGLLRALSNTRAAHAVIKAHALDRPMLALLRATGGCVILTTRDPRDSLLSMQDQFGHAIEDVTRQIALSAASVATVRGELAHLHLAYESRFTRRKSTIRDIAAQLSIGTDETRCEEIFDALKVASIRSHTTALAEQGYEADWFDPATHWHPGHVGDGRIDKWADRLSPHFSEAYVAAFAALCSGEYHRPGAVSWRPELFRYHDARQADSQQTLATHNAECLVHGPHFYLPAGRWRATFLLEPVDADAPANLRTEIVGESVEVLAMRHTVIGGGIDLDCRVEFDVRDHMMPLEARVHSLANEAVKVRFDGVDLEWISPVPQPRGIARPI